MLEVLARDGIARKIKWTTDDRSLTAPNILFLHSKGILHFDRGEGYLSADGAVEGKFTLMSGGSWFLERPGPAVFPAPSAFPAAARSSVIPPFPNIPAGLEAGPGEAYAASLADFRSSGSAVLPVTGVYPPDLSGTGAELFVFAGALENSFRPRLFAESLVRLKEAAGYGRLVYAPGLGEPSHLAFLAYCGIDLFDSAPLLSAARRGHKLFPGWRASSAEKGVCHCPACESNEEGHGPVYAHNCYAALSELRLVRSAIEGGRLRELVENRLSDPWLVAALRHIDLRHFDFCESYFPAARPSSSGIKALGPASLTRPEIARFQKRVLERYRRPPSAPVLLLLPCSARKPYSSSLSHQTFRGWIDRTGNPGAVHEVVVTSPLGVVPMELESMYPAGSYDVPVSGDWDATEMRIVGQQLGRFISAGRYQGVVCHLSGMDFLKDALPPSAISTGGGRATARSSVEDMARALSELVRDLPKVKRRQANSERFGSLARFQFGPGGEALADGCELQRLSNDWRITDGRRTQLALLQHERGLLSLTMDGAGRLLGKTGYEVEIGDFKPSGTVFMPGLLKAGRDIRPGDEVLVTHAGELRGVGVALMSASEMECSRRGAAVRMRHHLSSKEACR